MGPAAFNGAMGCDGDFDDDDDDDDVELSIDDVEGYCLRLVAPAALFTTLDDEAPMVAE